MGFVCSRALLMSSRSCTRASTDIEERLGLGICYLPGQININYYIPWRRMMSLYWLWVSPMLRTYSRIIALTAMVAGPSITAQAADQTTLTLACQGARRRL